MRRQWPPRGSGSQGSESQRERRILHFQDCHRGGVAAVPHRRMGVTDPQQVLAASDAIRNPGRPFSVTVTLTEFQNGKQVDTSTLVTYARAQEQGGQFASLVRFVLPARDTGKLMLKNGNDLWFYDPTTKASVRLSPQQRLMGQASNGDVVTVNMAKDYRATLLAQEEVQDGERRKRDSYKLGLTANGPDVTYPAIEIWIDASNNRPLKARFFAESGRLLKTVVLPPLRAAVGCRTADRDGDHRRSEPAVGHAAALFRLCRSRRAGRLAAPRFPSPLPTGVSVPSILRSCLVPRSRVRCAAARGSRSGRPRRCRAVAQQRTGRVRSRWRTQDAALHRRRDRRR